MLHFYLSFYYIHPFFKKGLIQCQSRGTQWRDSASLLLGWRNLCRAPFSPLFSYSLSLPLTHIPHTHLFDTTWVVHMCDWTPPDVKMKLGELKEIMDEIIAKTGQRSRFPACWPSFLGSHLPTLSWKTGRAKTEQASHPKFWRNRSSFQLWL